MRKTKKYLAVSMVCVMLCGLFGIQQQEVQAANPYLPLWEHIPDGEPRVFEDPDHPGQYRVYIYGSHDTLKTTFCGLDIVTWSAPVDDLNNWRYDGKIFESIVNGSADILYAPDVVEKKEADGSKSYYLYPNNQASGRTTMVAKSDRPDGPFEVINWKAGTNNSQTEGIFGFDPAVFIDDDGRAYGYWGFQTSYAAELDPTTMSSVKAGTQIITDMIGNSNDVPAGNEFRFFEASSLRKIGEKYVLVYSRKTKDGEYGLGASNNTLAYAYGDSPLGPWTYGGILVDARAPEIGENGLMISTQPAGNTHGSIVELNGQWYVFYHRSINNDIFSRQAMVAPINLQITNDGKVVITGLKTVKDSAGNEYTGAEVTSEGFELNGLEPYKYYSAGIASYLRGPYIKATYDTWYDDAPVINIKNNSVVGYKYFNFDGQPQAGQSTQLEVYVTPKGVDGTIDIMLDSPWVARGGKKIGSLSISKDAVQKKTKMTTLVPEVDEINGKHGLYFVFKSGSSSEIAELNSLQFSLIPTAQLEDAFISGLQQWRVEAGNPPAEQGLVLTDETSLTAKTGEDWKNYEFKSELQLSQGTVGLRFLQSDSKNYYELQLNNGQLELSSVLYGSKSLLKMAASAFKLNEMAAVSIAKVGDVITVRVNGIIELQYRNTDHDTGTVGLSSYVGSAATVSSVRVQASAESELLQVVNTVSINGVPVSGFSVSSYDFNVYEHNYNVPAGSTTVPAVTAASSDPDVKISVLQGDNPLGTAVVRFMKGDQIKTYKVFFSSNETIGFANGLPEGWEVVNPTDAANPLGAITTSGNAVTIQSHKSDSDYPNGHNMLQLPYAIAADKWTLTVNIKTDKPLLNASSLTVNTQLGIAFRQASSGDSFKLNAINRGTTTNVNVAGRSGTASFSNTSGTALPNPSNGDSPSYWLRFVKSGTSVQGYYSIDNAVSWRTIGSPVGFVDSFFKDAKLQLYTANLSSADLKASYTLTLVMSNGASQTSGLAQQAVEQAAAAIGQGIAIPDAQADSIETKLVKAQQWLDSYQELQTLGVDSKVTYADGQFKLSLEKGVASMVLQPFSIVTERSWANFEQLLAQAKSLQQQEYTAASVNKLKQALTLAETVTEHSDRVVLALTYDKLQAAFQAMEKKEVTIRVTGVTLNPVEIQLEAGSSASLTATVTPANATNKEVVFTSGNTELIRLTGATYDVATGTTTVTVHAVAEGVTGITATTADGGFTAQAAATIVKAPATARELAEAITGIEAPAKGAESLTLPAVPEGYRIAIKSSDSSVIQTNGMIVPATADTTVHLTLTVTRLSDMTSADTASFTVLVPGIGVSEEVVSVPVITADLVDVSAVANDHKVAVTLNTATAGAAIHYTVDGSEPTEASPQYVDSIEIAAPSTAGGSVTVQAKAWKEGLTPSAVSSLAITFKAAASGNHAPSAKDPVPGQQVSAGKTTSFTASDIAVDQDEDALTITEIVTRPNPAIASAVLVNGSVIVTGVSEGQDFITVKVSDGIAQVDVVVPIGVTAEQAAYSLSIQAGTGGRIAAGSSSSYVAGATVSIQATPYTNYRFKNWTSSNGGTFADAASASTVFTTPAAATVITANFEYTGGAVYYPSVPSVPSVPQTGTPEIPETPGTTEPVDSSQPKIEQGVASLEWNEQYLQQAFGTGDQARIQVPAVEGVVAYEAVLPPSALASGQGKKLEVATALGKVVVPGHMLSANETAGAQTVSVTLANASARLAAETQAQLGNRPAVELYVSIDGSKHDWSNPEASITVAIPYEPALDEEADLEHIVIWKLDEAGAATPVPTGKYDPATGMVSFQTTSSGIYAVTYVQKSFDDIGGYTWASKAIEIMAAKGVINGVSTDSFDPESAIKRGDFLLMLVKALGLSAQGEDNFADVRADSYYAEALSIAKKLGIASGVGDNQFNPESAISRQDMMTLIDRAMSVANKTLTVGATDDLETFSDKEDVAAYAVSSVSTLVKNGIVTGDNERLNPSDMATRAETAVLIYRIYNH